MTFPRILARLCVAVSLLMPGAVHASECMELWKERNDLAHQKGYCFGDALGKAYYGNEGCTTRNPVMSALETAQIRRIKARETQLKCSAEAKDWTAASLREAVGAPAATEARAPEPPKRQSLAALAEPKVDGGTWQKVQAALGLPRSGEADAATRAAIEEWQATNRLNQTGYLTTRQMNALLATQGAVAVNAGPSPAAPNAPIVLSERTLFNLQHTTLEADALLLAAVKSMPPSVDRNRVLDSLMSSGALKEFIEYGPQDWRDPALRDRFAAQLDALPFPKLGGISIGMQTGLHRELSIRRNQQRDMTAPISPVLVGQSGVQKFGVYQTRFGMTMPVHMDVPELPEMNTLTLTEQQANAILSQNNAYKMWAYVHLDVTDFRYDRGKAALVLEVTYRGADIRNTDTGQVFATYPAQAAPKPIPKDLPQLEALARIMFEGRAPNAQAVTPTFVDGYLHLGTANQGSQLLNQYVVSAMIKHAPGLLEDETFALDHVPSLMSYAERMQLFRGTSMYQQGQTHSPGSARLNGFDRRDVINRLEREFGAVIKERAKAEPLKLLHVLGVGLGEYDFESQSFPMTYQGHRGAGDTPARLITGIRMGNGVTNIMFDDTYVMPTAFPVPEQDARGIATRKQTGQLNGATVVFELDVSPLESEAAMERYKPGEGEVPFPNQTLDARVVSMALYADREMTEKLYQFRLQKRPPPEIGLLAPAKADQIPAATYVDAMRAGLAGPNGDAVLKMLTERSSTFTGAQATEQDAVRAEFARYYAPTSDRRDIWADAAIVLTEYLPEAQAFRIQGLIARGFDMQNLDQRYNGNVQFTNNEPFDLGLLPVTDEMLTRSTSVFNGYSPNDLQALQGQQLYGNNLLYAKVRFVPNLGKPDPRNGGYVYMVPDVREYYILEGLRTLVGGLNTIAYERFDGLEGVAAPVEAADEVAEEAAVEVEAEVEAEAEVAAEAVEEAAPQEAPVVAVGRDVLGIRAGMGRAEAEALVAEHMEGAERFVSTGPPEQPFAVGEMWVRTDKMERITLYYGSGEDADTVFGLLRVMILPDFAIPSDALEAATVEKYGAPTAAQRDDGLLLIWMDAPDADNPPEAVCELFDQLDEGPVWSGMPLHQALGYPEFSTAMLPIAPMMQEYEPGAGRYAGCGSYLSLTQTADGIVFKLADLAAYEAAITPPEPEAPKVPMIKL